MTISTPWDAPLVVSKNGSVPLCKLSSTKQFTKAMEDETLSISSMGEEKWHCQEPCQVSIMSLIK